NTRINQWVKLESLQNKETISKSSSITTNNNFNPKSAAETEVIICEIWQNILGVQKINRSDNFFELGGHSLLAIQLISAIRNSFHIDLGLEDIFNATSLSEMADRIDELISEKKT
ncbi:MAG: phosphopantetheine-binding protein, partial [Ignavibacteriaceae bacterium]|nr:phosphopantetheine-binding protein [Ignavibacteriaceae bacterium]